MYALNLLFYLKKAKKNKAGEAPIYMRITLDGERAELSVKRSLVPDNWDTKSQRVKGRSEKARLLNNYIDEIENDINRHYNIAVREGQSITAEMLKDKITGSDKKKKMLVLVFEEYCDLLEQEKGKKYAERTVNRYTHALKHLKSFLTKILNKTDIELTKLDLKFMRQFDIYLQSERNYHPNTVVKYLKILKTVIHSAISFGYIDRNPFLGYSTSYKPGNRQYLTMDEINIIRNKKFESKRLEKVRDVFIFICYTGISYSDLERISTDNITKGIDGKNWLSYTRKKTGIRATLPLLKPAQEVIDKYNDDPDCVANEKLLPIISNQKMNDYLEEIAKKCNINKPTSCHIGRHSFSVSVTLTNGVPIETVSKMLGHSNLKTTQLYSKVVDTKISEDMGKIEEKLCREQQNNASNNFKVK